MLRINIYYFLPACCCSLRSGTAKAVATKGCRSSLKLRVAAALLQAVNESQSKIAQSKIVRSICCGQAKVVAALGWSAQSTDWPQHCCRH